MVLNGTGSVNGESPLAILAGTWWYWVSKVGTAWPWYYVVQGQYRVLCLYILKKVAIWSGVSNVKRMTERLTDNKIWGYSACLWIKIQAESHD